MGGVGAGKLGFAAGAEAGGGGGGAGGVAVGAVGGRFMESPLRTGSAGGAGGSADAGAGAAASSFGLNLSFIAGFLSPPSLELDVDGSGIVGKVVFTVFYVGVA